MFELLMERTVAPFLKSMKFKERREFIKKQHNKVRVLKRNFIIKLIRFCNGSHYHGNNRREIVKPNHLKIDKDLGKHQEMMKNKHLFKGSCRVV